MEIGSCKDLQRLSETQLTFVKEFLKNRGFGRTTKLLSVDVGQANDNNVANVIRLIAEAEDGKTLSVIAKIAPRNEKVRAIMQIGNIFRNEITMYNFVLPQLNNIQQAIPVQGRFKYPICYGSINEAPNELILLEDLVTSGYRLVKKEEPMSDKCITIALKSLAKFHALSYALKSMNSEIFTKLKNELTNSWTKMNSIEGNKEYFLQFENDVLTVINSKKYQTCIKGSVSNIAELATKIDALERDSKYSVIVHGDCWSNNMLFKFQDCVPIDVMKIDFQISKHGSLAGDLLYFILNSTLYETGKRQCAKWIDCYYTFLDESLLDFGLKANFVYPREQLEVELKSNAKLVFAQTILLTSAIEREAKNAVNFTESLETSHENIKIAADSLRVIHLNDEALVRFQKKIQGAADSLIEMGYL